MSALLKACLSFKKKTFYEIKSSIQRYWFFPIIKQIKNTENLENERQRIDSKATLRLTYLMILNFGAASFTTFLQKCVHV